MYIKMTPEMWILSGLEKIIPVADITTIDNNRYIPYQIFSTHALTNIRTSIQASLTPNPHNDPPLTHNPQHIIHQTPPIVTANSLTKTTKTITKNETLTPHVKPHPQHTLLLFLPFPFLPAQYKIIDILLRIEKRLINKRHE